MRNNVFPLKTSKPPLIGWLWSQEYNNKVATADHYYVLQLIHINNLYFPND